ncbi:MAG TPA: hypothetical protein VJR29_03395 [bacterium]|nr:hypothetical protein [bacterium]
MMTSTSTALPKLRASATRFKRFGIAGFLAALSLLGLGCSGNDENDLLLFPAIVAVDSELNRVFVVDNEFNGLNLVDPLIDQAIGFGGDDQPLLDGEDEQLLPLFPSNAAVAALPGGVSRLFVVGGGVAPMNQVTVLDFDDVNLIRRATFSPIAVAGTEEDFLPGVTVAPDQGLLFVSNSASGMVHAYQIESGAEAVGSPIAVGGIPGRMNFDPVSGLLVVSNAGLTTVSFIDADDLAAPVQTLEVGMTTRDAAVASNGSGSALFVNGSQLNLARVFRLNLANLPASVQLFELAPNAPDVPIPDPNFVPGTLNYAKAAPLTDGRVAGFFTMSTGDLVELDLSPDLTTLTPAITLVGAISAEGLDTYVNASGQATKVYYASPGVGTLTAVNPLNNLFIDQIP